MVPEVGIFRTTIAVAPLSRPDGWRELGDVMVDSGSEYTWIPRALLEELQVTVERVELFETANGTIVERETGIALVRAAERTTGTIVVFAETGDITALGAVALEGMNLRADLVRRQLVPGGPVIAAAA
jgi:precorrin-4 methylase